MGIGGADWLVRSERESEEAPDAALDACARERRSMASTAIRFAFGSDPTTAPSSSGEAATRTLQALLTPGAETRLLVPFELKLFAEERIAHRYFWDTWDIKAHTAEIGYNPATNCAANYVVPLGKKPEE